METTEFRDLHAHYLAPSTIDRIRAGEFAPAVTLSDVDGRARFTFPTGATRTMLPAMADLDARLRHLDQCGIDIQVLSTWIDMFGYDLPEELAVSYHKSINEGLAEAVSSHPDRFRFFASVPLPWGDAAAAVLEDAMTRLGAVGSMIGTNVHGRYLDDERLAPFWQASERLHAPVELHPVNVAGADRLRGDELSNFLGNPFDTTIAASSLIFGGVLDRHPGLRFVLVHGGGYLPYAVGRLSHGRAARGVAPELLRGPEDYLDRFFFDTVVYSPAVLSALASIVGVERLVLGTDYPFDMEPPAVRSMVADTLGEPALVRIARTARSVSCRHDETEAGG
ncbi:MAG: aminocarboxymuconate-semialdehyde decarboxylase [Pseudonocardiales bacterium]|nr:amidohydrolase 2 [Pseudonocardia sp.]MDT7654969.1 aminocarboxymuconate-semialdehyde decarboxylase [Pseudonocardiales bacterium]